MEEQKLWEASGQPENIQVNVYKQGRAEVLKTYTLTKEEGWMKTFEDLPKYEKDGSTEIKYEVKEEQVSGFKKGVVAGDLAGGFTITNEKLPSSGGGYVPPFVSEEPKKEEPKTDEPKKEEPKKEEPVPPTPQTVIPFIPIPEIPISPDSEEPEPPVTPLAIVPIVETPKAPKTPPTVPMVEEEIPELELDGDEVPLGDTELNVDEDGNPKSGNKQPKYKKELARTGGLDNMLVLTVGIFFLFIVFLGALSLCKKKN